MRATLELNGSELCFLYIATGNNDAGNLIFSAIEQEKRFLAEVHKVAPKTGETRIEMPGPGNE